MLREGRDRVLALFSMDIKQCRLQLWIGISDNDNPRRFLGLERANSCSTHLGIIGFRNCTHSKYIRKFRVDSFRPIIRKIQLIAIAQKKLVEQLFEKHDSNAGVWQRDEWSHRDTSWPRRTLPSCILTGTCREVRIWLSFWLIWWGQYQDLYAMAGLTISLWGVFPEAPGAHYQGGPSHLWSRRRSSFSSISLNRIVRNFDFTWSL